ncbi:peroxidase family protein [Marinovum sp.]|uniref:peroxidase family protein n=1 Tax=Marinovum sp. TaxID=2024839 RepID=UPI003A94D6AB
MATEHSAFAPFEAGWDWEAWWRPLLRLTCILIGTMMFYRGLLNLFGYPGNPARLILVPVFFGGVFGIVLMWRRLRIGWWIFTALNFFVGFWFIFVLEDIWQHHVLPHIVFSAVFLPFYPRMKPSEDFARLKGRVLGWLGDKLMALLRVGCIVRVIEAVPVLHRWVNKRVIHSIVGQARFRPHTYSTMAPYPSWSSLTDRQWAGRHLGVSSLDQSELPPPKALEKLFERPEGAQKMCPKSTCLFPAFAQYLTDGFLRTLPEKDPVTGVLDPENRKRNNSNHEIDLCPLYGRTPDQTRALRVKSPGPEARGLLRSEIHGGEEYPPRLFRDGEIDPEFADLDPPLGLENVLEAEQSDDPRIAAGARQVRDAIFAVGGDRVNSVPQVAMMNTLWLREHNRLAREIGQRHPEWDDDQVFETARNVVIVEFIKIVVEDYINHIAPVELSLIADPAVCWDAPWNKPNWITTEFSLLYRWHALIPDRITWGDQSLPVNNSYFLNNLPLLKVGLKRGFEDISAQDAALLGPANTTRGLLKVERDSIRQGRICELASYNDYLEYLGRDRVKTFEEISSDRDVQWRLRHLYGDVDKVDFFVGIFCEDRVTASPLPQTILSFVALDAFSQALPNPLLSQHVFSPPKGFDEDAHMEHPAFSRFGWEQIAGCTSLREVVARNVADAERLGFVGMTQPDWQGE